ncbi:l-amino-acid amidase [Colletotrichum truncatum]|uniref:L-amino-acid amidase n=1 Tax=Colletotrichum truncatum TaxID=5467 RepID=A0ACC3YYA8_COLTU|nr:l-amino-acid amidase [Colletotrichum truncatum]KAF6790772.1 l-amino-acid amidase [Colletotrichum truncatum]
MTLLKVTEGKVPFAHPSLPADSNPHTFYRILGDISVAKPVVALHGGPGIPHGYLTPLFEHFHKQTKTPVILYDQIGCGQSTRYPEKAGDESFWTIALFASELDNLLEHLGVNEFDLYGHSWGGMLAAVVATESSSPKLAHRVEKLVLASSPASMKLWATAQRAWLKGMSREVQDAIEQAEKDNNYESKEYQDAVLEYYKVHLCRVWPFPQALADAFGELEKDPTVYMTMCGPSEITITGNLKDYDWIEESKQIKAPTLVIHGEFDEASTLVVEPWQNSIPSVQLVTLSDGAHIVHLEQLEKYSGLLERFLQG